MTKRKDDAKVDQASKDSFPASDPPANSGITGPRIAGDKAHKDSEARPKGTPTDERHATETAYHREDGR
jgi:hypothetical protein